MRKRISQQNFESVLRSVIRRHANQMIARPSSLKCKFCSISNGTISNYAMFVSYVLETSDNLVADYHWGQNSDCMFECVSFSICLSVKHFPWLSRYEGIFFKQDRPLFCSFTLCHVKNIFLGCDLAYSTDIITFLSLATLLDRI